MRVLVIEDDASLADVICRGLRAAGLAVDLAADGDLALQMIEVTEYDVLVLDRQLPGTHGDDVCRFALGQPRPPRVLMLTAAGNLDDRVQGLEIGADDYLPKPFAMAELVARIRALSRRSGSLTPPVIEIGSLRIDLGRRQAFRDERELHLTRKEFGLLEVLAANPGQVISAETLLERVWDEATDPFTNAVRITVMTLRRKLGEPGPIETVVGIGYRLEPTC